MTTGDIKNNIRKLISELKQVSYDIKSIDCNALIHGIPSAFLPIVHHTLLDYSSALASFLAKKDYELYARTDMRFVETFYRILLQEFSYKPCLTKQQFLALGFAERKVILLTDIVKLCREKHKSICKKNPIKSSHVSSRNAIKLSEGQSNLSTKMPANCDGTIANEAVSHRESKVTDSCFLDDNLSLLSNKEGMVLRREEKGDTSLVELPHVEKVKVGSGLPLPNLNALSWTKKADTETTIPQPCDSLTVTPLKDVKSEMDMSAEESKADVLDVEYIEPNGFKVVKHMITNVNEKDEEFNAQEGVKRDDTGNLLSQSGLKKLDSVVSNQSEPCTVASNECQCNCNQQIVERLQEQTISLQNSLKDLVTMSNELAARICLLETQNKLMEKKIESINSISNTVVGKLAAPKDYTLRQLTNNREAMNYEWNGVGSPKSRVTAQYSPDKYVDLQDSLPEDFEPINIAEMNKNEEMNEKEVISNSKHEKEIDKQSRDMFVAEEKIAEQQSKRNQEVISNEDGSILSPLHESNFSFMEENTRATVKNLQRKLDETMKLFQMQTK